MPKGKPYRREFKLEAIALWQSSGRSAAEVEDELGLTRGRLYEWKAQLKAQGEEAFLHPDRSAAAEEEIRRLRRELEIVTEERDILKKAVAIFTRPEP